jgi:hypothetical protein
MPQSHFFLKKQKKNPKKYIYKYMLGWLGGGRPPRLDFFFFKKKNVMRAFWE